MAATPRTAPFGDQSGRPPLYDKYTWRNAALHDGDTRWDRYEKAEEFAAHPYVYGGDPRWFMFHVEAGLQRDYVLSRIRPDLT